jgi:Rrf2 family transcriptional regulator, cysteine metabolism repressor
MKLSTKTRYGTRGLLELALHYEQGPLSLAAIAAREEISVKYLESLLGMLRSAGLVRSARGAQGGYVLARSPQEISLRDIFEVLEGPEAFVPCTDDALACSRWADCVTKEVWAQMYAAAMQVLQGTSLADLVQRAQERCAGAAVAYDI